MGENIDNVLPETFAPQFKYKFDYETEREMDRIKAGFICAGEATTTRLRRLKGRLERARRCSNDHRVSVIDWRKIVKVPFLSPLVSLDLL